MMPDCREERCARSVEVGRGCFRENRRRSGDATFFLPIRYEDGYILDRKKKGDSEKSESPFWDWLSHEDSNLDRQYQKL